MPVSSDFLNNEWTVNTIYMFIREFSYNITINDQSIMHTYKETICIRRS